MAKAAHLDHQNRARLRACRQILKIVNGLRKRHSALVHEELKRDGDGDIIEGLLDKGVKTANAILVLVRRNYPEDALILARSLAGLAIDIAYLSAKDRERFISYRAVGREARRRMAEQTGKKPPDADAPDWQEVKERARRWQQGGAIKQRAEKSDRLAIYEWAYRHGSSFEHSDAWSLMTYDPVNKWARRVVLNQALIITVHAIACAADSWTKFFGVEDLDAETKIKAYFDQW